MTELFPTLPGYSTGIVNVEPLVQQCGRCGVLVESPGDHNIGFELILSGFRFHACDGEHGPRLCPDCDREALTACHRDHGWELR